ncbi:hypothetical protein Ahy_B07g087906 [Arachis hypogaea]|uniref:Agenet domain-containing protein n=1 Tax=Arachis hypogaea TaxID=3818 RepID=A0A444YD93_ARAHY|nr:hypothetical protein Ahy_B07g087906 [Arachis hypogaea]
MDSPYCLNHNSPLIPYFHLPDPTHIPHSHHRYKTLLLDAFDNDGWWSGEITDRLGPRHYYVYFRTTNEEIAYPSNKIRVHHEWVNGDWILSQREQPQSQPLQNQQQQLGHQD